MEPVRGNDVMKKILVLSAGVLVAAAAMWASANPTQMLIQRISPTAQVCVAGQDCSPEAMASSNVVVAARSGQQVYDQSCAACHNSGAAGSPRIGAAGPWQERYDTKGFETLVTNSINGIGAMPPKGGCMDCSDDEIAASVRYILDRSL